MKTTKPMRARASVKAMPRNMVVRTMPADSGWRAIAEMRERAAADIEAGRQQAIADLRSEVSEIALGAAERIVGASLDRASQSQLIDAYIDEVASSNVN